jgi:hypothetical protein
MNRRRAPHTIRNAEPRTPNRALDAAALGVLVTLALLFALPLFAHPGRMRNPENGDTMNYYLHLELARRSMVDYGRFPWWTPYVHGGLPLVGHPRDVSLSPVVLPALVLPAITAVKVICLGIYLVGALGMYYLTRGVMGLGRIGSVAASLLLVTAAWLPVRLVGGNYDEWHFVLFPLLLAFYLRSREHWRYLIYGAGVLYVTLIDGKSIIAIFGLYLALIAAGEVVAGLVRGRATAGLALRCGRGGEAPNRWPFGAMSNPFVRLVLLFMLTALLGAVKIAPLQQTMLAARGHMAESGTVPFFGKSAEKGDSPGAQISRPDPRRDPGRLDVRRINPADVNFGTQGDDLGTWFVAPLLFLAACVMAPRRMLGWLALLALTVLLMLSQFVPPWMDLFVLLHRLPVFDSVRKPFKYFDFFVLFILCLGAARALGGQRGIRALSPRRGGGSRGVAEAALRLVLAAATVAVPYLSHIRLNALVFSSPVEGPPVKREGAFYALVAMDPLEARQQYRAYQDFFFVREGVGVLNWYDPLPLPCQAVPRYIYVLGQEYRAYPPYRGEAWLTSGAHAVIRQESWTPLGMTVDVELTGPDTLVINQNYNRRWTASTGEVVEHEGLVAVRLPADATVVRLSYRPTDYYLAAGVSLLTLAACLAAIGLDRRRRRRRPG